MAGGFALLLPSAPGTCVRGGVGVLNHTWRTRIARNGLPVEGEALPIHFRVLRGRKGNRLRTRIVCPVFWKCWRSR